MFEKQFESVGKESQLIPFPTFLNNLGRSSVWGWRIRKRRWINTVTIAGRLYVSVQEIELFMKRAAKGEFAKTSTELRGDQTKVEPAGSLPQ